VRRVLAPLGLLAVTAGDVFWFGVWVAVALFCALSAVAVIYQWRLSKQVAAYVDLPLDQEYEVTFDDGLPGDKAASDVYVGLMQDGAPTGPRKRARVLLDGSVRFVRPVFLPIPPRGYDEVGIWAEDATFRGDPLVRLSPWLCATETSDGNVAIANLTA